MSWLQLNSPASPPVAFEAGVNVDHSYPHVVITCLNALDRGVFLRLCADDARALADDLGRHAAALSEIQTLEALLDVDIEQEGR